MQGVWPGCGTIGDPLILGTFGREAAFGLPGLTAPGIAGCVTDGAVPALGSVEPEPVVPEGPGVAGAIPGAGAPPGCVGAVPVPVGELPVWAWVVVATKAARPAAMSIVVIGVIVWSLPLFSPLRQRPGPRPRSPEFRETRCRPATSC